MAVLVDGVDRVELRGLAGRDRVQPRPFPLRALRGEHALDAAAEERVGRGVAGAAAVLVDGAQEVDDRAEGDDVAPVERRAVPRQERALVDVLAGDRREEPVGGFGRSLVARGGCRVESPQHPRERLDRHARSRSVADDAREPVDGGRCGRMVRAVAQEHEQKPQVGGRGDVVDPLREELVHAPGDGGLSGLPARPRVLLEPEQRVDRVPQRARAVVVHVGAVLVDRGRERMERELGRPDLLEEGGRPVEQHAGPERVHDLKLARRGRRFDARSSRRRAVRLTNRLGDFPQ